MNFADFLPEILIGFGSAATSWFFARKKNAVEVDAAELDNVEKATAIWRDLASDLKKEVMQLRAEQEQMHIENQALQKLVGELKGELQAVLLQNEKLLAKQK